MKRRLLATFAATALAACGVSRQHDAPLLSYASSRSPDQMNTCLIAALNSEFKADGFDPGLTHHVQTTQPGRTYEIHPQQTISLGHEIYFVRVTKQANALTVNLYGVSNPLWAPRLTRAVSTCRDQPA